MPTVLNNEVLKSWQEIETHFAEQGRRLLTAAELRKAGLSGTELTRLTARGQLQRVERGVYALTAAGGAAISHTERLAELQLRYPKSVVCLHSAASLLGLTTEEPLEAELALPHSSTGRSPVADGAVFHWMSGPIYTHGQILQQSNGTSIRLFDAPKTVADFCARRNKVGRSAYLSILKAYLAHGNNGAPGATTPLLEAARICRVERIIRADLAVLRA